jgi:hypothetical protein
MRQKNGYRLSPKLDVRIRRILSILTTVTGLGMRLALRRCLDGAKGRYLAKSDVGPRMLLRRIYGNHAQHVRARYCIWYAYCIHDLRYYKADDGTCIQNPGGFKFAVPAARMCPLATVELSPSFVPKMATY